MSFLFNKSSLLASVEILNDKHFKKYKDLNYLVEKTGVKIISANNTLLKDSDFYDLMHLNEFGRERYEATFTQQLTDVANDSFSQ